MVAVLSWMARPSQPRGTSTFITRVWFTLPCCYIPIPSVYLLVAGGEGGTLREVLSHKSVERAVMIDLDQQVVSLCREHLPKHHQGAFDDPRVQLLHEDARAYLAQPGEGFDVMVMDLVDPMEGGPAYLLYTREYYEIARARLNPGGILVTQSGPAGLLEPPGMLHHNSPHVVGDF